MSGLSERSVVVFGSDGGGGRFAADLTTGELLLLPADGAVIDHVYLDEDPEDSVRIQANSMEEFLETIAHEVESAENY